MDYKVDHKPFNLLKISKKFFHIGIFLLPSAFSFSVVFLLISIFVSSFNYKYILNQKWNLPFFAVAILMLARNIISEINLFKTDDSLFYTNVSWIDLLNWIPLIWAFACFQIYLNSKKDRETCASLLLAGTVPILVSGFTQYFLGWHGPFEAFNGLLVWYQKSIESQETLSLFDQEKILIEKCLKKHNGNRKNASSELGISERTLYRKIKEFGI